MAVLVYIESEENKFKKTAYEALSYGKALADKMGVKVSGLVLNCSDTDSLKKYGADKIITIDNPDVSCLYLYSDQLSFDEPKTAVKCCRALEIRLIIVPTGTSSISAASA